MIGQRVVAVHNGNDYGKPDGYYRVAPCHNYAKGWKGTVDSINFNGNLNITFDNGRVIEGCDKEKFKISEGNTILTVGTKVLWNDHSYAMELVNGKPETYRNTWSRCRDNKDIYEITTMGNGFPSQYASEPNNTMICSGGRAFFVQQRFLREHVVVPKFKRGDFVEYDNGYFRILKVNIGNSKVTYDITSIPSKYNNEEQAYYKGITEEELKEVQ